MNVGIELRNTRLRRGLTLDELSKTTKIKVPVLRALEEGDVGALPPVVYVLGYLRVYAQEVGLEYDDIVHRYMDYMERESARNQAKAARIETARVASTRPAALPPPEPSPAADPAAQPPARFGVPGRLLRSRTLMAGAAVLLAVFAFVAFEPGGKSFPSQPVAADSGSRQSDPVPPSDTAPTASNMAPGVPFRIAITPTQSVWVSASADGQSVVSRQMNPGERAVIDVQGRIVLRISDPASVTWSIDGRTGRSLGTAGQYVTVQITRDTLDQFISD